MPLVLHMSMRFLRIVPSVPVYCRMSSQRSPAQPSTPLPSTLLGKSPASGRQSSHVPALTLQTALRPDLVECSWDTSAAVASKPSMSFMVTSRYGADGTEESCHCQLVFSAGCQQPAQETGAGRLAASAGTAGAGQAMSAALTAAMTRRALSRMGAPRESGTRGGIRAVPHSPYTPAPESPRRPGWRRP